MTYHISTLNSGARTLLTPLHGELAELERAGTPYGPHDVRIGGHARSEGLITVTNNMREFARMPGVRVESWV